MASSYTFTISSDYVGQVVPSRVAHHVTLFGRVADALGRGRDERPSSKSNHARL
jgi:hypothetical protein